MDPSVLSPLLSSLRDDPLTVWSSRLLLLFLEGPDVTVSTHAAIVLSSRLPADRVVLHASDIVGSIVRACSMALLRMTHPSESLGFVTPPRRRPSLTWVSPRPDGSRRRSPPASPPPLIRLPRSMLDQAEDEEEEHQPPPIEYPPAPSPPREHLLSSTAGQWRGLVAAIVHLACDVCADESQRYTLCVSGGGDTLLSLVVLDDYPISAAAASLLVHLSSDGPRSRSAVLDAETDVLRRVVGAVRSGPAGGEACRVLASLVPGTSLRIRQRLVGEGLLDALFARLSQTVGAPAAAREDSALAHALSCLLHLAHCQTETVQSSAGFATSLGVDLVRALLRSPLLLCVGLAAQTIRSLLVGRPDLCVLVLRGMQREAEEDVVVRQRLGCWREEVRRTRGAPAGGSDDALALGHLPSEVLSLLSDLRAGMQAHLLSLVEAEDSTCSALADAISCAGAADVPASDLRAAEVSLAKRSRLATLLSSLEEKGVTLTVATRLLWPEAHLCPITRARFRDPVIASDGHTYERSALQDHLGRGDMRSPVTRQLLGAYMVPNRAVLHDVETREEEVVALLEQLLVGSEGGVDV